MKNIKTLFILLMGLLIFTSCENDTEIDTPLYEGQEWIQFGNETLSVIESNTLSIPVLYAASSNESGITVNFTVTSEAPDRFTITQNGSIQIPANEFEGTIDLVAVDDNLVNGDILVTLSLSNTDVGIGLGGQAVRYNAVEITVVDNDCIPAPGSLYAASVSAFGSNAPSYTAQLTPVTGTTDQYRIDSAWGPDFVGWATGDPSFNGQFVYSGIITINPDLTITITGDSGWATGGTGNYDSCGDIFTFTLTQALFTNAFVVDVVLTAN